MAVFEMSGDIIPDEYQEAYDWYGFSGTSPKKVKEAFNGLEAGDRLQIKINSPGGDVGAGQEIYSYLRGRNDFDIEITGLAASAASIIAMAGHCLISPVGMVMIHNVWTTGQGNKNDLKKIANTLDQYDHALANAYVEKTGMSQEEVLNLMNKETWLPAEKAVELKFCDGISDPNEEEKAAASFGGMRITADQLQKFKDQRAAEEKAKADLLADLDTYGA